MKNILIISFALAFLTSVFGQSRFTKLLEKKYTELPVSVRIENSGIYAISSFDVVNDYIWINSFDLPVSYCVNKSILQKQVAHNLKVKDFISGNLTVQNQLIEKFESKYNNGNLKFIKSFLSNTEDVFIDNGGVLFNLNDGKIVVNVKNRNELQITYRISGFDKIFNLNFPSNLAYADLIGIDKNGNSFLIVETYKSDIPLRIQREVYTISQAGKVLSVLEIPSIKYLYMVRDFQIDSEGNLYQLLSGKEKISIVKWSGLTNYSASEIYYPKEYNYELNFNEAFPLKEISTQTENINSIQSSSRTTAVRLAESYVLFKYSCNSKNLSPVDVKGPDGDIVRTPKWLIVGENARVPYMWGGFSTLSQFSSGLQNGRYAGDINTAGVSNYAVGVDCSGFVSRCWQLSYHSSTSDMPSITTQYSSWDGLKPGDAIHKIGHVRLFIDKAPNGALRVAEASSRDWAVSYWTYTPSELTAYTPRYYSGMVNDYSFNQPVLNSVLNEAGNKVKISWTCDTTNVKGYRLYQSTDGINWSRISDESVLQSTNSEVAMNSNAGYFRVSSVLNNPPYYSESNWSNVLGAGQFSNGKKILIIDGFKRQTGGWRGNGTSFAFRYGKALEALNVNFETVKNSCLSDSSFNLSKYDAVYWMLGDESTADETFDSTEQKIVINYLENGGGLFVSGSEAGWDLFTRGNASDKNFYNNYLKASYIADNASSSSAAGIEGTALAGTSLNFGQTYEVDYPDEIGNFGGSTLCMRYSNNKGAGIQYSGAFGYSSVTGRIIYLGFPLETTADDTSFNSVISKSAAYFFHEVSSVASVENIPDQFSLSQNYPNPFNPTTTINFSIASSIHSDGEKLKWVNLKVYDLLGREVATLVNEKKAPGNYKVQFDGKNLPSGIYFYRISVSGASNQSGHNYIETKKLTLLK